MAGEPVRVVRHLARTGGTLVCKCLGSMDSVVLLSEVHPANMAFTNPVAQAVQWFGLVDEAWVRRWRASGGGFKEFIGACAERCAERGETLVVREWSHLDWHGVPFGAATMGSGLRDALGGEGSTREVCTVRHPMDQYVSLMKTPVGEKLGMGAYLEGVRAFAHEAARVGFVRYEDFTADPDAALGEICTALGVAFDGGYRARWSSYTAITGDTAGVGRASGAGVIEPQARREPEASVAAALRSSGAYAEACAVLGYAP